MDPPSSSPERPPVKVTYQAKQKRKRVASLPTVDDSESDGSNDTKPSSPNLSKKPIKDMPNTSKTESRSIKKVELQLPGPSPKRVRREPDGAEADAGGIVTKKTLHSRSTSSISSLSRVAQQVAESPSRSPSSFKKPLSSVGGFAKPHSLRRAATPESDVDDNASIADSTISVGKVRRTESERIEYFENQPDCSSIEPHQVLCTRCNKTVKLGNRQTYTVRPWEKHRVRCDQKPPIADRNDGGGGSDDGASVTPSVAETEKSIRRSESERKSILDADDRAEAVEPDQVKCKTCQKWIRLSTKQKYALNNWNQHLRTCTAPSSRVTTMERKVRIVNDSQVHTFSSRNVECKFCRSDILLEGKDEYDLTNWEAHKKSCTKPILNRPSRSDSITSKNTVPFPSSSSSARPPPSSASTDATIIASDNSPTNKGKRPREDSEVPTDDVDARPAKHLRHESFEPARQDPPGALGWFLLPFKAFVRGFRESLKSDATN